MCKYHGQRDTLYPWAGLLIKSVLVGTLVVVVCLEIEESSFVPFVHDGD